MRTTPNITNLLKRLGDLIMKQFIQSITGGSNTERRFSPLPPRMGGLGILVFSEIDNTRLFMEPLASKSINQERKCEPDSRIKEIKNRITRMSHQRYIQT